MNSPNLMDLVALYGTDDRCRETLAKLRWPDGIRCLRCNSENVAQVKERKVHVCYACNYQFSTTVGTMFHDSHLSLTKWFFVIYLMCESKKGISANQVKRMMGVSYKTAWYLCHRIRKAMAEAEGCKMGGTVQIDEVYLGGKHRHQGRKGTSDKIPVVGIRETSTGHVHLIPMRHLMQWNMNQLLDKHLDAKVEVIVTDESRLYNFKDTAFANADHETVNHSAGEYVRGDVTTNGIESVFSLVKRGLIGTWHQLSVKHLKAYMNEVSWRYNNRKNSYLFRDTLMQLLKSENMEYKELTQSKAA